MTRVPLQAPQTRVERRGVGGRGSVGPTAVRHAIGDAGAGAGPATGVGRAVRVGVGSAAAVGVMVCGLWLTFAARRVAEPAAVARPDLLEVGLRCGGIALMAAAQVLARSAVVGAVYPLRRGDWLFEWAAWAVMIVAAVGAVAVGLSGW